jgi:hypothetical protein
LDTPRWSRTSANVVVHLLRALKQLCGKFVKVNCTRAGNIFLARWIQRARGRQKDVGQKNFGRESEVNFLFSPLYLSVLHFSVASAICVHGAQHDPA